MGVALGIAGLAGGAMQAVGAVQSGYAKSEAASYRSQVAANNAQLAQDDAVREMQAGNTAAFNRGLKTRAQVASQKASQGASGIDVNTGSAVDVRAGTEMFGMLDALTIKSDAAKRAYARQVEATSYEAQSELDRAEAEQAVTAGWIQGAGTLLSSASSVGGNWGKYQTMFGG